MDIEAPRIAPETPASEVTQLFQKRDLVSAAVVGEQGVLLGRITVDDVVDVISEEAAHSVFSMAGLHDEEDIFAGVTASTRRRLVWLGINLLTAFLASAVVRPLRGHHPEGHGAGGADAHRRRAWAASPARRPSR